MIKEVQTLISEQTQFALTTVRATSSYLDLTQMLADLNKDEASYFVVLHIHPNESLQDYTKLVSQFRSLRESLTKRELEVLDLAICGMSNKTISEKLFITVETVKSHRKNIVCKAGVKRIEEIKDWLLRMK